MHKGLVQLVQSDGNVLATMLPGSHFGEIAVFGDGIRSVTATTKTACEIYYLKKKDIVETLGSFPRLKLSTYNKALEHLKSDLDDLHEAELGLSVGPPMTDAQIRATKKRVEKSIIEIEIEIESIRNEIAGRVGSDGDLRRRQSTSFLGSHRTASIELLKKLKALPTASSESASVASLDIKPKGRTFSIAEGEGQDGGGKHSGGKQAIFSAESTKAMEQSDGGKEGEGEKD